MLNGTSHLPFTLSWPWGILVISNMGSLHSGTKLPNSLKQPVKKQNKKIWVLSALLKCHNFGIINYATSRTDHLKSERKGQIIRNYFPILAITSLLLHKDSVLPMCNVLGQQVGSLWKLLTVTFAYGWRQNIPQSLYNSTDNIILYLTLSSPRIVHDHLLKYQFLTVYNCCPTQPIVQGLLCTTAFSLCKF